MVCAQGMAACAGLDHKGMAAGAGPGPQRAGSSAGGPELQLAGLKIILGPDFRAVFPVVLNVAVSGQAGGLQALPVPWVEIAGPGFRAVFPVVLNAAVSGLVG
eukprot:384997-Pelagomonas_calceolata.AAC.1